MNRRTRKAFLFFLMPIIGCRALAGRLVIAPVVLVARYVILAKILAPFEGQAITAKYFIQPPDSFGRGRKIAIAQAEKRPGEHFVGVDRRLPDPRRVGLVALS